MFTYREFIVRDSEENELVKVRTTFALMKNDDRKMARIPDKVVEPYKAVFARRIRRDLKPNAPDPSATAEKDYIVRYFDIDGNQHVNNSRYIEWLLDSLNPSFLSSHQLHHGIITFDKEVKEGDEVRSKVSDRVDDGDIYTDHQILVGETVHASASFKWKTN
ncbi:MAG: thioesterase [Alkalibacterium sp.]|nr:thioesterase [Alkalibacterium sp.]